MEPIEIDDARAEALIVREADDDGRSGAAERTDGTVEVRAVRLAAASSSAPGAGSTALFS